MSACFRPGDYVRCSVISLGSRREYVLSTARDDLGVVYAALDATQLAVVDSNTMICPKTLAKESRKVAIVEKSDR
jgi:exosome complex component CSL4